MGLTDRLADATRPTNSIEEVRSPEPQPGAGAVTTPAPGPGPAQETSRTPATTNGHSATAGKRLPYVSEPEAIARAYYVEDKGGERRYYDDDRRQHLAMRATGSTISSKREDRKTIGAMLALAQARGWAAVDLRGTKEFRREAWIEAQARGLETRGYHATDLDRQEADRRRAERGPANAVHPAPPGPTRPATVAPSTPAETAAPAPPRPTAPPDRTAPATERPDKPSEATTDPGTPKPSLDATRTAFRAAQRTLSADGRLVLAALSEKIERQMNRVNAEAKAELKLFVAAELGKKERAEGPVVLSAEQKRAAHAPEPTPGTPAPAHQGRRVEPDPPHRSRSR